MKKIGLICVAALMGMVLTACGNSASQKSNKKSSSSSVTTTKAVKHHKTHKESKENTQSSSSSATSSDSQASQTSTQQSSQNVSQQQAVQSTQQSNSQPASQSNSNGLPPANDLHDFVNRYGESPAAYLVEHNGMSPEQAVQSVPDTMKTSGEIQDTYQIQQGQDPFN
ncbi:hypothetical protein LA428_01575 [Limosilactobacillus fermentum]|uniref:hypothetical protein n=1 Tax=Limosilactobacillus fermentum TaxID=1613 RepID=UPI001E314967|nr:hypothetical protein [Limosilactobacillus fermentum]MCC6110355.1 hypothetical protein [Limosilactobacillus fermentum]